MAAAPRSSPPLHTALVLSLSALLSTSCGVDPATAPLPGEDDLFRYSLAVAERAKALAPVGHAIAHFNVGRVHQRFGLEDRALEIYAEALELDPGAARIHRARGDLLSERGDRMEDAIAAYRRSLEHEAGHAGVRTRIGLILIHLGRFDEARQALREEIDAGTDDVRTWFQLGLAERDSGDREAAVESFRRALTENPRFREARYNLARVLTSLGRHEEAEAEQARFASLQESEFADVLATTRPRDDLAAQRRLAGETWSDAAELSLMLAAVEPTADLRSKREREAAHCADESLRFDPLQPDAYRFLIERALEAKDFTHAAALADRGLAAMPDDPTVLTFAAVVLLDRSPRGAPGAPSAEIRRAVEQLLRAAETAPESATIRKQLAHAIYFRARIQPWVREGRAHAERALDLASTPEPILYDLVAMAREFNGDRAGAVAALRAGVEAFPDDAGLADRLLRLENLPR